ncbi:MAG: RNA-binding S4 domain-containing protein [Dermatophilaceae bacterium]
MTSPVVEVAIRDGSIRLGQLLKLAGVVDDGAAAREAVESGEVVVNGDVETRRGRQLRPGDHVTCAGARLRVVTR